MGNCWSICAILTSQIAFHSFLSHFVYVCMYVV